MSFDRARQLIARGEYLMRDSGVAVGTSNLSFYETFRGYVVASQSSEAEVRIAGGDERYITSDEYRTPQGSTCNSFEVQTFQTGYVGRILGENQTDWFRVDDEESYGPDVISGFYDAFDNLDPRDYKIAKGRRTTGLGIFVPIGDLEHILAPLERFNEARKFGSFRKRVSGNGILFFDSFGRLKSLATRMTGECVAMNGYVFAATQTTQRITYDYYGDEFAFTSVDPSEMASLDGPSFDSVLEQTASINFTTDRPINTGALFL